LQLPNACINDEFDKDLLQNPIIFIDTAGEMMNEEIQVSQNLISARYFLNKKPSLKINDLAFLRMTKIQNQIVVRQQS